jgi:hypothetical protein
MLDRMMENRENDRFQKYPQGEDSNSGHRKLISCAQYIADLNSINTFSVYLNPDDEYDYFIFQHGNNKDAIPEHYVSVGSMYHFDFDGDIIAAQEYIDAMLES